MHTVLITGAGSGIGAGLATELSSRGHHVVVSDVDPAAAATTATTIHAAGGSAESLRLDVTDDRDVAAAVESVSRPIDVLINNAGLQHVAVLEQFAIDRWHHLIDVMLTGVARMTRAVLPGMRARGFGRIINVGSIHSLVASPYKSAYVAAKHGLLGFSKAIALETADVDVTINTLCPSYVRTPLVEGQIAAQARLHGLPPAEVAGQVMLRPMPKGVFIEIDELAAAILFLMSAGARNVTGQALAIDGGWTVQ